MSGPSAGPSSAPEPDNIALNEETAGDQAKFLAAALDIARKCGGELLLTQDDLGKIEKPGNLLKMAPRDRPDLLFDVFLPRPPTADDTKLLEGAAFVLHCSEARYPWLKSNS